MEVAGKKVNYSWLWLVSILVFFFNTLPLEGLTVTLLLTPIWLMLLYEWKISIKKEVIFTIFLIFIFSIIHIKNGVILDYYILSTIMIIASLLFGLVAFFCFVRYSQALDSIFRQILILNFFLTILSIVVLPFSSLKDIFWYTISISQNIEPLPRLKLFTSEASHYSFLLAPLIIYFLSRILFFKTNKPFTTLFLLCLPLVLSFSLGVILCLAITGIIVMSTNFKRVFFEKNRLKSLLTILLTFTFFIMVLYLIYPENPLFKRIINIIHNNDTSARGRTYESFILAHKIAGMKSWFWGAGPGQLKVIGRNVIIQYYHYIKIPEVIRIPNACAETIVCYGYLGLSIRLVFQFFFFFKTNIINNQFRLWLFLFLFLYQFTGSYITNASEYLLWALAFSPVFPEFIKQQAPPKNQYI